MDQPVTMRFFVLLLAPVFCWAQTCDTAPAHKRYAFVVGDGTYTNLPAAPTAEADAQAIQGALANAGFIVTLIKNAAMPGLFQKDQPDFLKKIQPGDVVFFYYSGHAVQGPGQDDFILPFNFDASKEVTSPLNAFSLARFLGELNDRKPSVTLVMIEGPHPVGKDIIGSRPGLVVPDLSNNDEILFTMAAEGQPAKSASDSVTNLFTRTVADLLGQPGLTPSQLFDQAKQKVIDQSSRSQVPRVESNLSGASARFCFHEAIVVPPPKPEIKIETRVETKVETIAIPTNNKDHEEYVLINKGTFKMGCVPADAKCKSEEKPQHEITLTKDFWMGRNEVKVDSFKHFLDVTKKKMPRSAPLQDYDHWKVGNLPMVRVTWQESSDYCKWAGGRLPTEAEWEYAARAGGVDEIYPLNSENSRDKANFLGTQGNDTYPGVAPVRQFEPNKFKLFDMAGNVWEWVADWYGPYAESPTLDPKGPAAGKERISRGGSYESPWQDNLRLSLRWHQGKDSEDWRTGFRCVLDDTPETHKNLNIP
jgi:formylglycine-generating enzyme